MTRPLPRITPESGFFWTSGADGVLRLLQCGSCGRYAHPPVPQCRECGGPLEPQPVSGRGTVFSYTISHQQLLPALDVPYVIAVVALDEQDDVHLTTNLLDIAPEDVRIGLPVQVRFEQHDEVYLPMFSPVAAA